ncbi:MAG: ligase-associated DNA damage response endonuclease PdeM [Hyphomicrobium sp.]|jgi:DNA ligase-associated metallophosphoesterase|nr:ligase-associated DNA damage response endonuclease PdeM [Hyphomicrobium sp.]
MAILALKPERLDAGEFNDQPVSVCGKAFRADYSGALYWPAEDALIVADLHLEKGSSFARNGIMLPPYDTRETLTRLAEAIDRYGAQTIIALGDSLHDADGAARLTPEDRESLRILQEDREWIWITGNHDPQIGRELGGNVLPDLTVEGLTFRHEPSTGRVTHEIAAHLHPAAKLSLHGYSFRRPCFVGNGLRLVMPAFGTYTGGLNILDEAFDPIFGSDGMSVWMLGQEGLYPVAPRLLRPD